MTVLWSKYCPKHQSPSHTCQSVMIKVFVSNYNCDWFWVFTKGEVRYLLANRTRNFHRSYNFIALFLWGEPSYFSFLTDLRLLQLIMTQTLTVSELVVIESRDLNFKFGFNRQLGSYLVTCQPRPIRGQNLLPVRLPEWVRSGKVDQNKQGGKLLLINFY